MLAMVLTSLNFVAVGIANAGGMMHSGASQLENAFDGAPNSLRKHDAHSRANKKRFPIISHLLSPGRVSTAQKRWPHLRLPLCVVGDDVLSKHWLRLHRQRLIYTNTVCVVTNVASKQAYAGLSTLLGSVPHFVASADALARHTGIQHYPVWLTKNGVMQ